MEMEQAILEAIKKALPTSQFNVVAEVFAELTVTQADLGKADAKIKEQAEELVELRKNKCAQKELEGRKIELDNRQVKLRDDQHTLALNNVRCEMRKEMVEFAKDTLRMVFRNTEVKRRMHGSMPVKDAQGYNDTGFTDSEVTETQE